MRIYMLTASSAIIIAIASQASAQKSRTDPFAYCQSVRNSALFDETDPPRVLTEALKYKPVVWRCQDGSVYACKDDMNGRTCRQWKHTNQATTIVRNFCAHYPGSQVVPNSDNDTILTWKCVGTTPVLDKSAGPDPLDRNGYRINAWQKVPPPAH
jgi:hypothetical protein